MPDTPEQMQERLDELGETIDAARRQAEQDDLLPDDEPEPMFHEWSDPPEYEPKPEDDEDDDEVEDA